jgi:predicted CxxxxCH...CXXCH cytochrome family protein
MSATYGGTWTSPSCASVYCHSNGVAGTPAYVNPNWSTLTTTCTTCHGGDSSQGSIMLTNRHGAHVNNAGNLGINFTCTACHANTVSSNTAISNYSNHVNKLRDVAFGSYSGTVSGTSPAITCSNTKCHAQRNPVWTAAATTDHRCVKCHGQAGVTAPTAAQMAPGNGRDLDGSNSMTSPTSDIQVGTHQQHLNGVSSTNIATVRCIECHTVPNNVTDNNHLGRRAAEVTFANATAARKNGATPTFSASSGSVAGKCSNVYCHGAAMPKGDTSGTNRTAGANSIFWNQTSYRTRNTLPTNADCGVCHGNPPTTGSTTSNHSGYVSQPTTSCATCHNHFNANGTLNNPSLHINGRIDGGGGCNGCHDYDTRNGGGSWGKGTPFASGGWGAHAVHINYIKTRWNVTLDPANDTFGTGSMATVCGVCHSMSTSDHTMDTPSNPRNINFNSSTARQFGESIPVWNTSPRNCSNIDCHYFTSPVWQ